MTFAEFLNGIKALWDLDRDEYLSCINKEDREHFGDEDLWVKFRDAPHKTFVRLPTQDQERIFALIEAKNKEAPL